MADPARNSNSPPKPRRWSIIAAGLLLIALAIVVLYTGHSAFASPLAMVVLAAIGFAALLLRFRLRKNSRSPVRAPLWLNVIALLFGLVVVFADLLHFSASVMLVAALGAIVCFAISGIVILRALRNQ